MLVVSYRREWLYMMITMCFVMLGVGAYALFLGVQSLLHPGLRLPLLRIAVWPFGVFALLWGLWSIFFYAKRYYRPGPVFVISRSGLDVAQCGSVPVHLDWSEVRGFYGYATSFMGKSAQHLCILASSRYMEDAGFLERLNARFNILFYETPILLLSFSLDHGFGEIAGQLRGRVPFYYRRPTLEERMA